MKACYSPAPAPWVLTSSRLASWSSSRRDQHPGPPAGQQPPPQCTWRPPGWSSPSPSRRTERTSFVSKNIIMSAKYDYLTISRALSHIEWNGDLLNLLINSWRLIYPNSCKRCILWFSSPLKTDDPLKDLRYIRKWLWLYFKKEELTIYWKWMRQMGLWKIDRSLMDLYRGIILGTDTSSIVLDKIKMINQFSEQTCSDGDHHNMLFSLHSQPFKKMFFTSTPLYTVMSLTHIHTHSSI